MQGSRYNEVKRKDGRGYPDRQMLKPTSVRGKEILVLEQEGAFGIQTAG